MQPITLPPSVGSIETFYVPSGDPSRLSQSPDTSNEGLIDLRFSAAIRSLWYADDGAKP